jgi:hypothetical protein
VAIEPRLPQSAFPEHHHDFHEIVIVEQGTGDATLVMRKIISHRLIVMKGWLSGLQFLTAKFVNPVRKITNCGFGRW